MSEVIDISPGNLKAQAGIKIAGSSTVKTVIGKNKQTNKQNLFDINRYYYIQTEKQPGPAIQHKELYSIYFNNLQWK